ncbi:MULTISPECIES: hypothetical protein [unclassified Methylobacterium]|uniref:hypothetical protein n=1 Tax=unclassified Methylobacterium TaxID=2615210 RepID=UPI0011C1EFC5|nr:MULTISPECIES: hypothetical protein [unclassified Methylobacterium]QEE41034.1 hypothetical protein FVA80_20710 [Methylobacterium sp. WL1]TXN58881.1 hypothetical protein FV241_04705 [Methylobacterium sp. WL2]
MTVLHTPIHAGGNDDHWFLCQGEDPADVFVYHEPNVLSGGSPSRIELAAFLVSGSGSPEHRALLTMIGSLVEAGHAGSTASVRGPGPGAAGAEPTPGEAAASI